MKKDIIENDEDLEAIQEEFLNELIENGDPNVILSHAMNEKGNFSEDALISIRLRVVFGYIFGRYKFKKSKKNLIALFKKHKWSEADLQICEGYKLGINGFIQDPMGLIEMSRCGSIYAEDIINEGKQNGWYGFEEVRNEK